MVEVEAPSIHVFGLNNLIMAKQREDFDLFAHYMQRYLYLEFLRCKEREKERIRNLIFDFSERCGLFSFWSKGLLDFVQRSIQKFFRLESI